MAFADYSRAGGDAFEVSAVGEQGEGLHQPSARRRAPVLSAVATRWTRADHQADSAGQSFDGGVLNRSMPEMNRALFAKVDLVDHNLNEDADHRAVYDAPLAATPSSAAAYDYVQFDRPPDRGAKEQIAESAARLKPHDRGNEITTSKTARAKGDGEYGHRGDRRQLFGSISAKRRLMLGGDVGAVAVSR